MTLTPDDGRGEPGASDTRRTREQTWRAEIQRQVDDLYTRRGPAVFASLRSRGAPRDVAEDLVHEAAIRMGNRLMTGPVDNPDRYFTRIAINAWKDRVKSAAHRRTELTDAVEEKCDASGGEDLDDAADDHELLVRLAQSQRALEKLTGRQRDVVEQRLLLGASTEAAADVLGLKPGNVRYHLWAAKRRLRKILKSKGLDGREGGL